MSEKEDVQLKDLEKGEENTTEKSPLKEPEKDQEGGDDAKDEKEGNGRTKELTANQLIESLRDPKIQRIIIPIALALFLLLIAGIIISLLMMNTSSDEWIEDPVPRMLRLVPTPTASYNMIKFRSGSLVNGGRWDNQTQEIKNLYEKFDRENVFGKKNVTNCENRVTPPADEKYTCFYDTDEIRKACSVDDNFGYPEASPCIFIQFNHVHNFTPEVYTKQDLEQDTSLPESLRSKYQYKGPWVECRPNEIIDTENAGTIKVIPSDPELPRYSFPYKGHPDYMAPFVAIKLEKPNHNVAISITCRLWARNIIFNSTESGYNDTMVDDQFVPSAILPFTVLIE